MASVTRGDMQLDAVHEGGHGGASSTSVTSDTSVAYGMSCARTRTHTYARVRTRTDAYEMVFRTECLLRNTRKADPPSRSGSEVRLAKNSVLRSLCPKGD
ncbi:hypothetical protein GCM10011579_015420 [Streptomyces albiflavescens]|uniref:Uncharacterized protein n=1 Tax=Streptomyces albiflavescens TaxID=1623582 RepID=A0A917XWM8_9ACTN|nr:hypothetical protein GCM10011579_015420 [Streptomyces albiflavescens]